MLRGNVATHLGELGGARGEVEEGLVALPVSRLAEAPHKRPVVSISQTVVLIASISEQHHERRRRYGDESGSKSVRTSKQALTLSETAPAVGRNWHARASTSTSDRTARPPLTRPSGRRGGTQAGTASPPPSPGSASDGGGGGGARGGLGVTSAVGHRDATGKFRSPKFLSLIPPPSKAGRRRGRT